MQQLVPLDNIRKTLQAAKVIAVVGLSPKENRPSNMVARYLLEVGYNVIPVNPGQSEILGQKCYAALTDIPGKIDIVDIFRKSEDVPPIIIEAVQIGAGCIWMQKGIINDEAHAFAEQNNLVSVMDRCIMVDHQQLL